LRTSPPLQATAEDGTFSDYQSIQRIRGVTCIVSVYCRCAVRIQFDIDIDIEFSRKQNVKVKLLAVNIAYIATYSYSHTPVKH